MTIHYLFTMKWFLHQTDICRIKKSIKTDVGLKTDLSYDLIITLNKTPPLKLDIHTLNKENVQ